MDQSHSNENNANVSEPKKGPFVNHPTEEIVQDFIRHVKETGAPDAWKHHTPTTPPADADYLEVMPFAVPESLRTKVAMASCPICSPLKPKYYVGALAWFPAEGVLRAIGHECAKTHFGAERVEKARNQRLAAQAQDYLIEALPAAGDLRARAARVVQFGHPMDQFRDAIRRWSSRTACDRIAKLGSAGQLPIWEEYEVDVVDGFGRQSTRRESRVVEQIAVQGLDFLGDRQSSEVAFNFAEAGAREMSAMTPLQALDFVIEISEVPQQLFDAERILRATISAIESAERKVEEIISFCRPANLQRFASWTRDSRIDAGLVLSFSQHEPSSIRIRRPGRDWQTLTIPSIFLE